jgi:hypothetical protein
MVRLSRSSLDLGATHLSVQPENISFHGSTQNLQISPVQSHETAEVKAPTSPFLLRKMPP